MNGSTAMEACAAGSTVAPLCVTSAMKRYPRRGIVSMKLGLSAESPNSSRMWLMASSMQGHNQQ